MSSCSLSAEIATVHLLSDGISLQSTYFLTMTSSFGFEKHKILRVQRSEIISPNALSGNTPFQSECRRYTRTAPPTAAATAGYVISWMQRLMPRIGTGAFSLKALGSNKAIPKSGRFGPWQLPYCYIRPSAKLAVKPINWRLRPNVLSGT
jgi:hypothetical protein